MKVIPIRTQLPEKPHQQKFDAKTLLDSRRQYESMQDLYIVQADTAHRMGDYPKSKRLDQKANTCDEMCNRIDQYLSDYYEHKKQLCRKLSQMAEKFGNTKNACELTNKADEFERKKDLVEDSIILDFYGENDEAERLRQELLV